jgi:hypothetical protein
MEHVLSGKTQPALQCRDDRPGLTAIWAAPTFEFESLRAEAELARYFDTFLIALTG